MGGIFGKNGQRKRGNVSEDKGKRGRPRKSCEEGLDKDLKNKQKRNWRQLPKDRRKWKETLQFKI